MAGHLDSPAPGAAAVDIEALRALRWRVVHLVEQAACIAVSDSNEKECRKVGSTRILAATHRCLPNNFLAWEDKTIV